MCYSDHFFATSLYPHTPAKIHMISSGIASLVHVNSERISISRSLEARPNTATFSSRSNCPLCQTACFTCAYYVSCSTPKEFLSPCSAGCHLGARALSGCTQIRCFNCAVSDTAIRILWQCRLCSRDHKFRCPLPPQLIVEWEKDAVTCFRHAASSFACKFKDLSASMSHSEPHSWNDALGNQNDGFYCTTFLIYFEI